MFGKGSVLAVAVLVGGLLGGCQDTVSDRDITRVGVADVQRLARDKSKTLLLDPRPAERFATGHLPDAVNIPLEQIPAEKGRLRPNLADPKFVVVYGENPGDAYAIAATKRLLRAGQRGARLFSGGLSEWRKAGLKVESSATGQPDGAAAGDAR